MSTKHTPGPWTASMTQGGGWAVYTGKYIYNVLDHTAPQRFVNAEANARLIAAAPELLAALEWLVNDMADAGEDRNPETGQEYDSVASARTAIRKARGES